uniref:Uncharacterized protein n=1 Tax=Anguilla anguilla TaxID=7936 RepID=A0A0E9T8W6_ANGAN
MLKNTLKNRLKFYSKESFSTPVVFDCV